ncbi:GNAT family N-acetyltransferase [Actinomarinicola tropica]|uniref:GNAT family N-acetyltransferase n=1 Tax=Actinomarinicola tropica TaxID=2789776 RepID=A0A5Q2RID1_9ACTN|nr:GNAT family N-acetyltransferase [Actinomarinicola tropica]QGG94331.1 GNAT family N-acetyltransferase [Actinomarinicola tropica]
MDDVRSGPDGERFELRPYRPGDEDALMAVCLGTGASGEDATDVFRLDPRLLSEIYLLPYLALESELATVVADGDDRPVGYVLGALDTAAFEAVAEERWWPALRERFPLGSMPEDAPEAALVRRIHEPGSTAPDVLVDHPSHLHVDLLPVAQGRGLGRRLLQRLFDQLAAAGSTGVHLGVSRANERAIGFYRAMGFVEWPTERSGALTFVRRMSA